MHVTDNELKKFQNGTMNTEEMTRFLEHMEQCDFCLDQLLQDKNTVSERAGRNPQKSFLTGNQSFQKNPRNCLLDETVLCRTSYSSWNGYCSDHAFFCITGRFYCFKTNTGDADKNFFVL